jgi:hypothetical protein
MNEKGTAKPIGGESTPQYSKKKLIYEQRPYEA